MTSSIEKHQEERKGVDFLWRKKLKEILAKRKTERLKNAGYEEWVNEKRG